MRVADIIPESTVDGPGLRLVLFVQGCNIHCDECHNKDLWDIHCGEEKPVIKVLGDIVKKMTPLHRGVTISGGEPFLQARELAELCQALKRLNPHWDIMVYTGYPFVCLVDTNWPKTSGVRQLLGIADYLKTEPYKKELRDPNLKWRGSSNQRLWMRQEDKWIYME